MKKILALLLTLALLMLCVCSCSASKGDAFDNESIGSDGGYPNLGDKYYPEEDNSSADVALTIDRKIIKTVNQSLQTDDFDNLLKEINSLISTLGGYVSESNLSGENYYHQDNLRYASLTLRIPAEKLSEFTAGLDGKAVVTNYNESEVDVTGNYIDVESRLSVLRAEETALLDMLGKSSDVDTMIKIRTRLNEVQSDIASLEAQKKDYDSRIAYSTVYLRVNEVRRATGNDPTFFEEVGDVFMNSLYDIGEFFRGLGVFLIGGFLYIIIWGGVIFAALFLILKFVKKRREKKKNKKDEKINIENGEE